MHDLLDFHYSTSSRYFSSFLSQAPPIFFSYVTSSSIRTTCLVSLDQRIKSASRVVVAIGSGTFNRSPISTLNSGVDSGQELILLSEGGIDWVWRCKSASPPSWSCTHGLYRPLYRLPFEVPAHVLNGLCHRSNHQTSVRWVWEQGHI